MSEEQDWAEYVRATHNAYVARYVTRVQEHPEPTEEDFEALSGEWPAIKTALEHAQHQAQGTAVLDLMRVLRQYFHLRGDWSEGVKCTSYAVEALAHVSEDVARAEWYFYAGLLHDDQGHYGEAQTYYERCLESAEMEEDITTQTEAWRRLGWLAHIQGERQTAQERYEKAAGLHRQMHDALGLARDLRQIALLALETGDYLAAEKALRESLDLIKESGDWQTQQVRAAANLDLGRIHLRQDDLGQAAKDLKQAETDAKQVQDRMLLADIHYHLGLLAEKSGDLKKAKTQYTMRLELAEQAGDLVGQTSAAIALGTLALQREDFEQAWNHFTTASEKGDRHNRAVALAQLGTLTYMQKDYKTAATYLTRALDEFEALAHRQEVAECHQQLGVVAQAQRQWQVAVKHYQTSLDIHQALDLLDGQVLTLYQLGTLAQQLRQIRQARAYYEKAYNLGRQCNFANLAGIHAALLNVSR